MDVALIQARHVSKPTASCFQFIHSMSDAYEIMSDRDILEEKAGPPPSLPPNLPKDEKYFTLIATALRICLNYKPKFGKGHKEGFTLGQFHELYGADPFYHWFGVDSPLMYAAHKAAGGMTSVYRQIGIGCEALFRRILQDSLGLSAEAVRWSYEVPKASGGARTLHLDGRVPINEIKDKTAKK